MTAALTHKRKLVETLSALGPVRRLEAQIGSMGRQIAKLEAMGDRVTALAPEVAPADLFARLTKKRGDLLRAHGAAQKSAAKVVGPVQHPMVYASAQEYRAAGSWQRDVAVAAGVFDRSISGVTADREIIAERVLEWPNDDDTTYDYEARSWDVAGSYCSLMFRHWMNDKTHWYSADVIDLMWMISHYGYTFPAPSFDGVLRWEADLRLLVSAFDGSEDGFLLVDVMLQEQPEAGAPPATFEAYPTRLMQMAFDRTEYRSKQAVVTGEIAVRSGKKSRIWLGLATLVSAREGTAGTNGWSYLMVAKPPGAAAPGVKYTITQT